MTSKQPFTSVDEYIALQENSIKPILEKIREIIKTNAPEAIESIAYGMPAYKSFKKPLVYFAAYANHIGLYATPSGHDKFKAELSKYKQGKGSVQFPLDSPMPFGLIEEIVKFRATENRNK